MTSSTRPGVTVTERSMTPAERREHWGRVHLAADRRAPFVRHEPGRPFWMDEATVRKLLAKRNA